MKELTYRDNSSITLDDFDAFRTELEHLDRETSWIETQTKDISVEPVSGKEHLFPDAECKDTLANTGLCLRVKSEYFLLGESARKSLFDRAQISGRGLTKLPMEKLATVLTTVLESQQSMSKIMLRSGKVRFVASGDKYDYAYLAQKDLIAQIEKYLDERFPGSEFTAAEVSHPLTVASWSMEAQADVLDQYLKILEESGYCAKKKTMYPALRFTTSDTGVASAAVTAAIKGGKYPIFVGSACKVNHRNNMSVSRFNDELTGVYAGLCNQIDLLRRLTLIPLSYPANALKRLAKKFCLPKDVSLEQVSYCEMIWGDDPQTAHDVYLALQEIIWLNQSGKHPWSPLKMLQIGENVTRCLTMSEYVWHSQYDTAKGCDW